MRRIEDADARPPHIKRSSCDWVAQYVRRRLTGFCRILHVFCGILHALYRIYMISAWFVLKTPSSARLRRMQEIAAAEPLCNQGEREPLRTLHGLSISRMRELRYSIAPRIPPGPLGCLDAWEAWRIGGFEKLRVIFRLLGHPLV